MLHIALEKLVDGLEAEQAVLSPGSRNAPVMDALLRTGYQCCSAIDERSAAFQALGMAKGLKQAVVLSCTSGTAALNYYPAIAEAFYARVPLIVLTADRPPEQIDQWDGQAIRQNHVFEAHCRASFQCPDDWSDPTAFTAIAEAVNATLESGVKGPIHINIPIREPFYRSTGAEVVQKERKFLSNASILLLDLDDYLPEEDRMKKVLVVNGMEDGQLMIAQCRDADAYDHLVVLSDVTSNQASSVRHWDAMLYTLMRNTPEKAKALQADILITTGTFVVSKGLKKFLQRFAPEKHYHISRHQEVGDPFGTSPLRVDPYVIQDKHKDLAIDLGYYHIWQQYSNRFFNQLIGLDWGRFHEFSAVRQLLPALPPIGILHLANSMAVRYVSFLQDELDALEVFGNRGTSGIDGCTSTALGHAMVSGDQPVFLLTGDLAFMYDVNALWRDSLPKQLKIIVLNNAGGRIFEFIDGPEGNPERAAYQLTPHQRSAKGICGHFGLEYFCARDPEALSDGLSQFLNAEEASVLEIFTEPDINKSFYEKYKAISYE